MRRTARPLMYLGVLAIVFGLALVHARYIGHYPYTGTFRFAWTVAYAGLLCLSAYAFGLPDMPRDRRNALSASVGASFSGALAISVVQLFLGDALLPRFVVFGSALLLPDWLRICVRLSRGSRRRAEARDRVLVIGEPEEVQALEAELQRFPERPASIVGSVGVESARQSDTRRDVRGLAVALDPTVVVLDRRAYEDRAVVAEVASLHERGVRVRTLTLFYVEWLAKLPLSELERTSLLFDIGELHRASYGRSKRMIDVVLSSIGVLVLVIVTPFVYMANLVGNRGPMLYRQQRIGKGGAEFTIVKFRTMRPRPSGELFDEWTTEDDPRITPFGRFLRTSHLDELPQVLNILRGDLSVVGPRPEQPHYVAELTEKLPFYGMRHLVRPGLTGWAQVKYGYAGSPTDALEKLQYEFFYLQRQTLRFDLRILGRTVRSVFVKDGR